LRHAFLGCSSIVFSVTSSASLVVAELARRVSPGLAAHAASAGVV
jgi:hypothetical protein